MSKVCGTSEQARALKDMLTQSMQLVENNINQMERAVNNIHAAWNDEGAGEVDEILASIKKSLREAQEAAPQIGKKLEAYAQFLDSI